MSPNGSGRPPRGKRPQPWGDAKPQDLSIIDELPRLRVEYAKDERLAYLGHLEVIETIMRCVRRAGLPFSLGNGFARRMRIQFSQALPVGASSACEYFDLRLTRPMDAQECLELLRASTPSPLAPTRAGFVAGSAPALESWLTRAGWRVEVLGCRAGASELACAIEGVRAEGTISYLRGEKTKRIDVASSLVSFEVADACGCVALTLDTRSSNAGSLRPQVLLDAAVRFLGMEPACAYDSLRVRRVSQHHEDEISGRLVKPL